MVSERRWGSLLLLPSAQSPAPEHMNHLLALLLLLVMPVSAYAYVDPGSGMLLWQGLIAVVGAIVVFVRHPIQTLRDLLKRLMRR